MKSRLLHNPRCSKSREAKKILDERGVAYEMRDYLNQPLSRHELKELAAILGVRPMEMIRTKEAAFKEHGLDRPGATDQQVLDAMAESPILLERPIFLHGSRGVIGRPPERVLEIL